MEPKRRTIFTNSMSANRENGLSREISLVRPSGRADVVQLKVWWVGGYLDRRVHLSTNYTPQLCNPIRQVACPSNRTSSCSYMQKGQSLELVFSMSL